MEELITLGQVIKPQGIKGEVKVKPFTDDVSRFFKLRAVFLDSVPFKIETLRVAGAFVYIKFANVNDRNIAESHVGKFLRVDRVHAVDLDDGAYFITDVIGCDLVLDGNPVGKISEVHQHGSADVFEVKLKDGGIMMFPHLKRLELIVDTQSKTISCKKELIDSVAVYQD